MVWKPVWAASMAMPWNQRSKPSGICMCTAIGLPSIASRSSFGSGDTARRRNSNSPPRRSLASMLAKRSASPWSDFSVKLRWLRAMVLLVHRAGRGSGLPRAAAVPRLRRFRFAVDAHTRVCRWRDNSSHGPAPRRRSPHVAPGDAAPEVPRRTAPTAPGHGSATAASAACSPRTESVGAAAQGDPAVHRAAHFLAQFARVDLDVLEAGGAKGVLHVAQGVAIASAGAELDAAL